MTGALVRAARFVESLVDRGCNFLLVTSGLSLLIILTSGVIMRYGFETGFSTSVELTELSFSIFVMAGVAQAARRGAHVATELMLNMLAPRSRRWLALLIHATTTWVYLLLAWVAYQNAVVAHDQSTPVLQIPYSVGYGILAAGLSLVAICSIAAIVRLVVGKEAVTVRLGRSRQEAV